jgi:hypothetical protein
VYRQLHEICARAQLAHQVGAMEFDRLLAQTEFGGDLLENLALPLGKRLKALRDGGRFGTSMEWPLKCRSLTSGS